MKSPKALGLFAGLVLFAITTTSCSSKRVMVPPRIDLQDYPVIALVQFTSNADGNLASFASQKFVETLQSSQPGVRVLELGDSREVLAAVGHTDLDYKSVRAIGEEFGADAVIVGDLEVTDVKPSFDLSGMLTSGSVRADVEAGLAVRLFDGRSGATIWTSSCQDKESVAHIGLTSNGGATFGAEDPEAAYGKLVNGLVYAITDDFRVHYVKQ